MYLREKENYNQKRKRKEFLKIAPIESLIKSLADLINRCKWWNKKAKAYDMALIHTIMSLSRRRGEAGEGEKISVVEELIKLFFEKEDHLTEQRIHQLVYLSEIELSEKDQPMNISFIPFIDGIYSKEVDTALSNIDNISKDTIRVRGDQIDVYRGFNLESNLNSGYRELANRTYEEYSEYDSKDLMQVIRDTRPFKETRFGEKASVSDICNSNKGSDEYTLIS